MGNHEFCEKCYENDFHWGRPCDPVKVAEVQSELEKISKLAKIRKERLLDIKELLNISGFESHFNAYNELIVTGYLINE